MKRRFTWLFGSSLVAVGLSIGASVQGGNPRERGCAILPPYESPDPPGFNSANGDVGKHGGFFPYYSPLVPISVRWDYKKVVPYYPGYLPKGKLGSGACCPPGAGVDHVVGAECGAASLERPTGMEFDYGVFTGGAGQDSTRFWRMGGNGLVPYGTPQPPRAAPDLIDRIEGRRGGAGCP